MLSDLGVSLLRCSVIFDLKGAALVEKQTTIVHVKPVPACDVRALMSTLSSVAHDIGNLVQSAASTVDSLAHDPAIRAGHMNQVLGRAESALDHAGLLVRRIIRLSRYRVTEPKPVHLAACLAEVESVARSFWDRRYVVEVQVSTELPEILCDVVSLQNAVLNLLANARDAMPTGGVISVRAEPSEVGSTRGIALSVSDDGVGMAPETMSYAFKPFFTTKSTGLAGMGLPMVERFVREAGGRIHIESALGVGTTVTLLLPAIFSFSAESRSAHVGNMLHDAAAPKSLDG